MTGLRWTCPCGDTALDVASGDGTALVCYCRDCRAFTRLTGGCDDLDAAGGTALYQVAPSDVTIARGAVSLRALRLTRSGPIRWQAGCCSTALGLCGSSRSMPFVSLHAAGFPPEARPTPIARVFRKSATGPVPTPHGALLPVFADAARRAATAWISGDWRRHPFFDASGAPLIRPETPHPVARRNAYARG